MASDFFSSPADRALEEANAAVETAKSKSILPAPSAAAPSSPPQSAQLDPNLIRDFEAAAVKHNVPVDVLMAMAEKDSGFDPLARSRGPGSKTRGIIKTSDEDVAKNPGVNPYVAPQAIEIAAGKLRGLLDSGKTLSDALKSIASGPNPDQWGPDAAQYADDVLARSQRLLNAYEQQTAPPPAPAPPPAAPPERPGILAQAAGDVVRGVKGLKNTGVGLAALAADAAGFDHWATSLLQDYVANEQDIQKNNAPVIGSYKNIHSLGDAGRYAVEAVAENLPMMVGTMGAGAVGGVVARKIAQRAVADMVEKQVAEGIAKSVAEKNVADYVARRTLTGAAGGAYAGSAGMESGSIMGDIYSETGEKRPGLAAGFGAIAGALDAIEPIMAIKKVVGPAVTDAVVGGLVKRLGVEGAKQFATEAGTEGLQTVIEKAAVTATDGRKLFTPELLDEVIDSALKGGFAGGVTGVGSQAAGEALNRGEPAAPDQTVRDPAAMRQWGVTGQPGAQSSAAMAEGAKQAGPISLAPEITATTPGSVSTAAMAEAAKQAASEPPRDIGAVGPTSTGPGSVSAAVMAREARARGPLARVLESAAPGVAPLSNIVGERVVLTDENGQMAGHVVGQDDEGVIFKGDDGQEQLISHGELSSGAVNIAAAPDAPQQEAPAPAPPPESGPSTESVAAAVEPEAAPAKPVKLDLSEQASAKAPATGKVKNRDLAQLSEPELRDRLKAIASQAKAGSGWNKALIQARRLVETEIEARKAAAPEGSANVQERPASSDGLQLPNGRDGGAQSGKPGVGRSEGGKTAAPLDTEGARTNPAGTVPAGVKSVVRATGLAEPKPALNDEEKAKAADYASRNWWGARTAAASFIENKGLGDTHEIKQTGERKFQVVPKAEAKFPAESGTLGIPRAEMPQVKSEHHGALVNHLNAKGIAHETTEVPAADLKPTQAEYSPEKVARAKEEGNGDRSVIVSNDGHIIDGHHQAVAAAEKGENVKAIVLDAPVKEALEAVKSAPMAKTAEGEKPAAKEQATRKPAEIVDNGATNPGEFIVRDAGSNLARFEIGKNGRPVRVKHFYDSNQTRDFANESIEQFLNSRSAPKSEPAAAPQSDIKFRDLKKMTQREAGKDPIKQLHIGEFRVFAERASPYAVAEGYGKTPEEARANARRALEPKSAEPETPAARPDPAQRDERSPIDRIGSNLMAIKTGGVPRAFGMVEFFKEHKLATGSKNAWDTAQGLNLTEEGERVLAAWNGYKNEPGQALIDYAEKFGSEEPESAPKPLEPAIAKGELPVEDARERQRLENIKKMEAIEAEKANRKWDWPISKIAEYSGEDAHPAGRQIAALRAWAGTLSDAEHAKLSGWGVYDFPRVMSGASDPARVLAAQIESLRQDKPVYLDPGDYSNVAEDVAKQLEEKGRYDIKPVAEEPKNNAPAFGANNKLVSKDRAEELKKRLKQKFKDAGTQFNSGIDPEFLAIGTELSAFYLEGGVRKFADFAKNMSSELGISITNLKPYLRSWYNGARDMIEDAGLDISGMEGPDTVRTELARLLEEDASNEPAKLDEPSESPLAGVPADEVQGTEAERDARTGSSGRGGADVSGNERPDGSRIRGTRGVGNGARGVSVPARGTGTEGEGGQGASGKRGGEPVQRDRGPEERDNGEAGREPSAGTPAGNVGSDFAIGEEDRIGEGGAKTKFRQNVAAIRLLRQLELSGRPATREEQSVLAKWVGWGGLPQAFERSDKTASKGWEKEVAELKELLTPEEMSAAQASTRNAHYTSPEIVKAMWDALRHMGFTQGRVLEPSVGAGNFFGLMPADMRSASQLFGVELDHITGGIAKNLYPAAKIASPMGFQDYTFQEGFFDAVIGNPPFGSEKLYDPLRKDLSKFSIHNYFFAKALDGLKPGGVMTMVVTNRFMDGSVDAARKYIADRADLVAAIRLPNDAFLKNAGTQVTTDIIILRKRKEGEPEGKNYWGEVIDYTDKNGDTVPLNVYFHQNPKNMLGEFGNFGTMYAGRGRGETESALVAREGQDTAALLAAAISRLPRDITTGSEHAPALESIPVTADLSNVRVGSMFIQDGEVLVRDEDSLGEPRASVVAFPSEKARERVMGMLGVRDSFADLRRLQLDPAADDMQIGAARHRLNTTYDAFVKVNGFINSDANKRLFRDDPSWPQISALENSYDKGVSAAVAKTTGEKARGPSAEKAAVFTRRTQSPYSPPTRAASAKDALVSSLAERGRVDLDLMERLYGKTQDEIVSELGDLVFTDPVRGIVTRDEYLSGNVKKKLAEAEAAARKNGDYRRNVEALKAVQPEDIPAAQIEVKAGAHWIPRQTMIEFVRHISGGRKSDAFYNPASGKWTISADASDDARVRWATPRASVAEIITAAAAQKAMVIYDRNPDDTRTLNEKDTEAANAKVAAVADEWKRWIFEDDQRRADLGRLYNDMFNTDVKRQFDGSHLTFPGKVGDDIITLRPHQKNAIWRILQSPTTLLDHVVGAGKTFTVIGAVMEGKRMGLMQKPILAVPNHLVEQWAADFIRLYPSANILAATKKDFEKENRKRLFARIATGDWDAVIVAHSSFGKVEVDPEAQAEFIEKQVEDLIKTQEEVRRAEGKEGRNVKKIQEAIAKKREKVKKLLDTGRKDDSLYFGELGIDAVLVDEAHEFKNLEYSTSMSRVAGLGSQKGSQKASDLYLKVDQVLKATGGRNIVFATGTPISNTMAEMFTMQRYLDGKRLEEQGLSHFDAWARMYGEIVNAFEISPAGKYKMNSRFAKFSNLPELMQSYTGFADVINRDDINALLASQGKKLPVPKMKGGKPQNIVVERSKDQAAYIGVPMKDADGNETDNYPEGSLIWRSENLPKGPPQKGDDNMLKIMSDARKAALDMRLIDPSYPDHPGSKVNDAAKRIKAIYDKWHADKGAQLVFIDLSTPKNALAKEARELRELIEKAEAGDEAAQEKLDNKSPDEFLALDSKFSVYDDLREKLISMGIPANEVEFIHSANTDQQKADLFGKVRSGSIRVLLGSTAKMGAGMNVQDRLVALHHLDAPWRPSDLEQREGRIIRQGNKLYDRDPEGFEVEVNRYATKQSLDSRMWQTIEGKANFIEQIRKGTGERSIEDIGGEAMNSAEMKAASSGNPLIFTAMELEQKIRKLNNEEYNHRQDQYRVRDAIRWNESIVSDGEERVDVMTADLKTEIPKDFAMNVRGTTFDKRKDAGEKILEEAKGMAENGAKETLVGSYGGFKLTLEQPYAGRFWIAAKGVGRYETTGFTPEDDPQGVAQRVLNALPGPARIKDFERTIDDAKKTIEKLRPQIGEWPKRAELDKAKADHAEIVAKLRPKQKPAPEPEGEAKASVGSGTGGMTAAALKEHLIRGQDGPLIAKMLASGRITVHDDESTLPGSPPAGAQGVTMPDGKIHLVAGNLSPETARAVLLHEAFHAGGAAITGAQGWKALMWRVQVAVDRAVKRGDTEGFWFDAMERAEASGTAAEEVAAYAIENYEQAPAGLRDITDKLIGIVKAWALKTFGRQFGDVTPAQLRALAVAALRSSVVHVPTTDGPGGIRYSIRSPREAIEKTGDLFEKAKEALSDFITDRMVSPSAQPSDTASRSSLMFVPVRSLFLEVAKGLNGAKDYIDTKAAMDAERNKLAQETDVILQRWFKWATRVKMDGARPRVVNREENVRLMDLMHETTIAGVDPSKAWDGQEEMTPADRDELRNRQPGSRAYEIAAERQARDDERRAQYDGFKARYDAIPEEAKAIYNDVRDAYRDMADETERLVLENMKRAVDASVKRAERAHDDEIQRITDEGLNGKDRDEAISAADKKLTLAKTRAKRNKAARLKRMREEFEKNRVQEPYFPLSRFGSYFVTVRDQENKVVSFSRFESAGDQRRFADEMRQDPLMKVEVGVAKVDADFQKAIDPKFMANLDAILEGADVPNEVRDQVWQRYLESLPDLSMRKHRIHRKNRAGFNADALRAFAHVMFHGGHQMARLKYGVDLQEYIDQMGREVKNAPDPVRAGAVYNEIVMAHNFAMNPEGSAFSHRITSMVFLWTMAFNISSAIVNVEQTWSKGIPALAFDADTKAGNKKAFAELARATRDFFIGKGAVENASTLTDDERRAIRTGYELGTIDRTQAHELASISESGVSYNPIWNTLMKGASYPMHLTERSNREITFLAAYRIARQAGLTHEKAVAKAADLTWMTHYDTQGSSKPRFMRGDNARMIFALKSFQANVLFRYFWDAHEAMKGETPEAKKLALGRLTTTLGLSFAMAGLSGGFAMHTLLAIAGLFMWAAGNDDDPEEELRRAVAQTAGDSMLGHAVSGVVMDGLPGYITGTALSDRLGTADLWFRSTNRDMTHDQKWLYVLEQLGGAPAGLLVQIGSAYDDVSAGNTGRGVEKMTPAAIKNVLKAIRYASQGVTDKDGNPIVEYVPVQDIAKQVLGFTPAAVKEQMDRNSFQTRTQKRIETELSTARRAAARAQMSGDEAAQAAAAKKVEAANEKYPEAWIKPKSIMQTMRGMESRKDRMDFGVDLNPKLEERIKGATAPSIYRR